MINDHKYIGNFTVRFIVTTKSQREKFEIINKNIKDYYWIDVFDSYDSVTGINLTDGINI